MQRKVLNRQEQEKNYEKSAKNEMNIVFESYSDKLVTKLEEINEWIESL